MLGDARITEQQLTTEVQAIFTAQGQPVDTADADVTSQTLARMIIVDLADMLSEREGVVVNQMQIDEQLASYLAQYGDQASMEAAFAEQGVAPSQIQGIIRLNIQAQQLGVKLLPNGTAEEQGQAVVTALGDLSNDLDVTASPRFGTWDGANLQMAAPPDDLAVQPSAAP